MTTTTQTPAKRASLRSIALPSEHGGWGFLLEPLFLGLLLAPTWAGLLIAASTISIFLLRHPLRLTITDWKRGRRFHRTRLAERFVIGYGLLAGGSFALAIALVGPHILRPLVVAIPFALIMIGFDARGQSRHWLPEIAGPIALSTSAPMIALAGGWALMPALGLILLLAARAIPAILYVRSRLRLAKKQPAHTWIPRAAHIISLITGAGFAITETWPALTVVALAILLLRAVVGLRPDRQTIPPKIIGFQELAYGAMMVILTAAGFHLSL
ncbi:MAG: YwiC-like family protein [Anaerolineae bacterium]|nr:YwiC-like family protein [Anaerolineae bacterium]